MKKTTHQHHRLKHIRRGWTCTECGEYFSSHTQAAETQCDPQRAAEKADDVEMEALVALGAGHPHSSATHDALELIQDRREKAEKKKRTTKAEKRQKAQ